MSRTAHTRPAPLRRLRRTAAGGLGALLMTAVLSACGSGTTNDDTTLAAASASQAGQAAPAASGSTRTSGNSLAVTDDEAGVALRGCPAAMDQKAAQDASVTCLPMERLRTGTSVTMRCWTDSQGEYSVPEGFSSPRWFYVTDVDGPHPGWSGYVYSDLVDDQIVTPACTPQILARYPFHPHPDPEPVVLRITGSCTTEGGTLSSTSSGFEPGGEYYISASYPDGTDYPLDKDTTTARQDGSVPWSWTCAGDPAGTYTTRIGTMDGRVSTDPVHFTIGAPAPEPTQHTSATPAPKKPPVPTNPPAPVTVQVTVSNLVTNGATRMREDDEPAYLSTRTVGSCRLNGCEVDGTEMSSGAVATAVCQLQGDRITNGQDNSAVDDGNPGLYSSARWYRIRWADGREGYLSEVWLRASDRGGKGLPGC
ncbi:hypothetical protein [Streptomyces sp. NBC_01235]|uniref:hypothetical protein n=1 Tax=Streptomyces sp. NBC_01235 TaxID=2903788 RepID=UPI002E0DAF48|nr:hypothetical protein OG289_13140 [Streptomyces sp. NBC_01235]